MRDHTNLNISRTIKSKVNIQINMSLLNYDFGHFLSKNEQDFFFKFKITLNKLAALLSQKFQINNA